MIRLYQFMDKDRLVEMLKLHVPMYFAKSEIAEFRQYLEEKLEEYYVIEENGQLIGAGGINYFPGDRLARISWDIVHPEFQGNGKGMELLLFRMNRIKKNSEIREIVVRTSQQAHGFYAKAGFQLERVKKDFWAEGI